MSRVFFNDCHAVLFKSNNNIPEYTITHEFEINEYRRVLNNTTTINVDLYTIWYWNVLRSN